MVGKLETVLNDGQKKQLREKRSSDPFGFSSFAAAGQPVPLSTQITLKLTAEQKKQLAALQKDVDAKLDQVLRREPETADEGDAAEVGGAVRLPASAPVASGGDPVVHPASAAREAGQ